MNAQVSIETSSLMLHVRCAGRDMLLRPAWSIKSASQVESVSIGCVTLF